MSQKISRREFLRLLGMSGAAAYLAACAPTETAVPTRTPTLAPAASGVDLKRFSGTTLTTLIIQFFYTQGLEPQLPEFENMTGINVNFEKYGVTEAFAKADIELAGRTGAYNAISLNEASLPRAVEGGWITPLDQYINDPSLTDKEQLDLDDFFAYGRNAFTRDGQLYGLPDIIGMQVLYIRKDLFDKYNVTPPTNLDELMAAAESLHGKDGVVGIVSRSARGRANNVWAFLQLIYGHGGRIVEHYPDNMKPALNAPETIEGVEYCTKLFGNYSLEGAASIEQDAATGNFIQGNAAMLIEGAPHIGRITDPEQSQVIEVVDVLSIPEGPAGFYPSLDAHAWVIPADSENKEAAWLFANWATSKEVQREASIEGPNSVPTRKSITELPEFEEKWSYAEGSWLAAYKKTLSRQGDYYGSPNYMLPIPEWPELGDRLAVALSEALTGAKSAEQAMNDAQEDVDQLLDDAGYY